MSVPADTESSKPDFFLAYAPEDERVAAELHSLLSAHHNVFFAPKSLLLGDDSLVVAEHALREARVIVVLVSPKSGSDYFRREQVVYALNLLQKDPDAHRVVPLYLDGAAPEYPVTQKVSLILPSVEHLRHAATQLAELLARLRGQVSPALVKIEDPFRKLREFTFADQDLFFGRDLDVRDLADEIRYRLVVLHGASGTGKTSLLQAGLRPTLQREYAWVEVSLQQDADPAELIMAQTQQHLAARGDNKPPEDVAEGVLRLARLEERRILLVLDHAEKIFQAQPQARIQERCQKLANAITAILVDGQTRSVHVLFAMRDDFHGQLRELQKAGLHTIFDHGRLLRPLEVSAARRALSEPLLRAGCPIPANLVGRIVEDLCGPEREINPVELQIIGDTLFQRARKLAPPCVTDDLYRNLGGVGQVLAAYLAEKLGGFPTDKRRACDDLLCALIAPGGERSAAMTAAALAVRVNLDEQSTSALIAELVNPLRLLRSHDQDGQPVYRLAHDQVAKAMFARLEEARREDIQTRSELQPRIAEWKKTPLPSLNLALLSLEQRLAYQKWFERNGERATSDEKRFLSTLRRVELAKRVLLAAVILLIPLGAWIAMRQVKKAQQEKHEAERQRIEAQAREAEAKAEQMLERDPGQALAWLEESARFRGGIHEEDSRHFQTQWLMASDAYHKGISWIAAQHGNEISSLAFSPKAHQKGICKQCWPNNRLLLTASQTGDVSLLDLAKGGKPEIIYNSQHGGHTFVAFSPDGETIAICNSEGSIIIVAVETRRILWSAPDSDRLTACAGISYSHNGEYLAAADSAAGLINIWRINSSHIAEFEFRYEGFGKITNFAFSPKYEKLIAVIGNKAYLQSIRGIRMTLTTIYPDTRKEIPGSYHTMSFSPDGQMLALAKSGTLIVWRFNGYNDILGIPNVVNELVQISETGGATIFAMAWSERNNALLLGDQAGQVTQWGSDDKLIRRKANHAAPLDVIQYSHNQKWILSGDSDGGLKVTDIGAVSSRILLGHDSEILAAQFSPDDRFVASADANGTVRLWIMDQGHVQVDVVSESLNQSLFRLILDSDLAALTTIADLGETFRWFSHKGVPIPVKSYVGAPVFAACQPSSTSLLTGMLEADGLLQYIDLKTNKLISATRTGSPISSLLCDLRSSSRFLVGHVNGQVEQREIGSDASKIVTTADFQIRHMLARNDDISTIFASFDRIKIMDQKGAFTDMPPIPSSCRAALDLRVSTTARNSLLIGCASGLLMKLDTGTKQYTELENRHKAEILRLALMPQNGIVASASNGPIKITWENASYSRQLFGHRGAVTDLAFSNDNRYLVSIGLDGTLRRWPLPPSNRSDFASWIKQARTYKVENATAVPQYLPPLANIDQIAER